MNLNDLEYTIKMRCATCGCDNGFEFNADQSYIKCTNCGREYFGGKEELVEANIDAVEEVKKEMKEDVTRIIQKELQNAFKKAFKK